MKTTITKWLIYVIPMAVMSYIIFYWMYVHNIDFLWKAERLSLFVFDDTFFHDKITVPGGMLQYLGCFFTQFFYNQLMGTLIYIIVSILLAVLIGWSFRLGKELFVLSFIPVVAAVLSFTELGYMVYVLKFPGFIYSIIVGIIVLSLLFGIYIRVRDMKFKYSVVVTCLLICVYSSLYAFIGIYAIGLLVCCSIYELLHNKLQGLVHIIIAVVCIISVPYLYASLVFDGLNTDKLYRVCLPDFIMTDESMRLPFIILAISLIILSAIAALRGNIKLQICSKDGTLNKKPLFVSGVITLASMAFAGYMLWHYSFTDKNFYVSLKAERAAENKDWNAVIDATASVEQPTRVIVLLRNLALFKIGEAGDRLFKYPDGSSAYNVSGNIQVLRLMCSKILYYNYGKINYCYRWCMEDKVEYALCPEQLIYMIRCSLLNGEWNLARKYISTLKQTLFYEDKAKHYESLLNRTDLIKAEPEFCDVINLMGYNDILDGDGGLIEVYLLNNFANMSGGNEELVILSTISSLILKNPEIFWRHFLVYAKHHETLPVHFQEAALLFGWLQNLDVSKLAIREDIKDNFMELVRMAQEGMDEETGGSNPVVIQKFGGTYWYYYFFVKGLHTN